jgi:capsular exopolysaccharide synthesis family protein
VPSPDVTPSTLRLSDIVRVLRRRWLWLAGTTFLITALVLAFSLTQQKLYQASARILVRTVTDDIASIVDPNAQVPFFADRQLKNTAALLESTDMRAAVASQWHGHTDVHDVTASPFTDGSDIIELSVKGTHPRDAADLVNLYARTYLTRTTQQRDAALANGAANLEKDISDLDAQRARISAPLDDVNAQLAAKPDDATLQKRQQDLTAQLSAQLQQLDAERTDRLNRLNNVRQLSSGLGTGQTGVIVSDATPPSTPVSPTPVRDGAIGLVLGLGLGIALAFVREFLDESIRTVEDVDRLTDGVVPALSVVPTFDERDDEIVSLTAPGSAPAEAFRALRTSVRFVALGPATKVIQVTSPWAGDGKTTVVANLAVVLAQAGYRVAVVSCDLRRPTLQRRFGVPLTPGLTDVLLGECPLSEAIQQTASGVYVLPSGPRPPNPSELLGSSRTQAALEFLSDRFDFVLLDSTPVLAVTDATVVSQFAQATLLVVAAGSTSRNQVRESLKQLDLAGAQVVGMVLNKASGRERAYEYPVYPYPELTAPSDGSSGNGPVSESKARAKA